MSEQRPATVTSLHIVRQIKDKLKIENTVAAALLAWMNDLYLRRIITPPSYQARKTGVSARATGRSPIITAHALVRQQRIGCARCGTPTGLSGETLPPSGTQWVFWSPPVKYIPHKLRETGVLFLLCHPCTTVLAKTTSLWKVQLEEASALKEASAPDADAPLPPKAS